mmetsp:Transcript_94950/g.188055  ORF Transcript_94950/g.188055 Transcript_94950/m.188055 type:complete len:597 (+) Transcript_94950:71-1861(+)
MRRRSRRRRVHGQPTAAAGCCWPLLLLLPLPAATKAEKSNAFRDTDFAELARLEQLLVDWKNRKASLDNQAGHAAYMRAKRALQVVRTDLQQVASVEMDLRRVDRLLHPAAWPEGRESEVEMFQGMSSKEIHETWKELPTCTQKRLGGMDASLWGLPVGTAVNTISWTFIDFIPEVWATAKLAISVVLAHSWFLQGYTLQGARDVIIWMQNLFQSSSQMASNNLLVAVVSTIFSSLIVLVLGVIATYAGLLVFGSVALFVLAVGGVSIAFVLAVVVAIFSSGTIFAGILTLLATPLALVLPLLTYMDIGHVDFAVLFCVGEAGFSPLLLFPYSFVTLTLLLDLVLFFISFRQPDASSKYREPRNDSHLFRYLEVVTSWIVAHLYVGTFLCTEVCPAAVERNWLPLSIPATFLFAAVASVGFATVSSYLAISKGYRHQMVWLAVVLLEDMPQLVAAWTVNYSCTRFTQYSFYSAVVSPLHIIGALVVLGTHYWKHHHTAAGYIKIGRDNSGEPLIDTPGCGRESTTSGSSPSPTDTTNATSLAHSSDTGTLPSNQSSQERTPVLAPVTRRSKHLGPRDRRDREGERSAGRSQRPPLY